MKCLGAAHVGCAPQLVAQRQPVVTHSLRAASMASGRDLNHCTRVRVKASSSLNDSRSPGATTGSEEPPAPAAVPAQRLPQTESSPAPPPPPTTMAATTPAAPSLRDRALAGAPEWQAFLGTLANSGAITGTLLDGIHSRMGLQVYDVAPVVLGGLNTSLAVPPLLALFYMVLGSLHPIMDNLNPSPETDSIRARSNDVGFVALAFGVLAGLLQLSATLYDQGVPYWQIHVALGTSALVNWRLFDGTKQGLGLALLCGLGAPAAEVVLLQFVPLWHYPRADVGGTFVSWVFWCYFFYTPALGSLARYLWFTMRELEQVQREVRGAAAAVGTNPTVLRDATDAGSLPPPGRDGAKE